ncbi:hypothetical protein [Parvicella tangerina]|uniref:Outer membrane protein beta-barrel domain-containing protein n=1 Tax=Parvicella tangerina TaxID=2829795 RepID=A0A916NBI1_9FLAO|nr:hypothetical protein [Parvicella tangerina]CAG5083234.1 hypothetical protein CRYO30217_02131 [Parvicella tangerina]
MNNELFDRMIKENLQDMQVAPSAGLKKVLGWKLFFQNLVVFHKIKVAIGLLLVSTGSTFYFVTMDNGEEAVLSQQPFVSLNLKGEKSEQVVKIVETTDESNLSSIQFDAENSNNELAPKSVDHASDNNTTDKSEIMADTQEMSTKESSERIASTDSGGNTDTDHLNKSKFQEEASAVVAETVENQEELNTSIAEKESENMPVDEAEETELASSNKKENYLTGDFTFVNRLGVDLKGSPVLAQLDPNKDPIPFLNNGKGVFGELSFDLYKGMMGKSELKSDLRSAIHRQYYWDFHGENDVLTMNVLGGANVNYSFGARVFRIKASAGINYFTVNDTKAVYEFEEITDPVWLNFFNTDELAWVDTYGKDTCTQCFYAHNTKELQNELKEEYNQYSYLKVPLQLGAQFNFKYVSLDLLGGVDVNLLTNSHGLYVKQGLDENYERFYYWDNLQLSTLSKESEMLKKSFVMWSLAANLRVRVTKNFDLMAGYQVNNSFGSITDDSYLMKKSLKSSNMTVGLTYYPFRTKLNPNFVE